MLPSASDLDVRPLTLMFRALGDETRLRIVALLVHGELCVCHLEKALGLSQPNVSRQLGILRSANIVEARREGTWVYYSLSKQNHEVVESQLGALVKTFGAERSLRTDHGRLRKSCGPNACK
ncbi:MAG TPA: metalloregulator ArsR/SmtB family transcription factor [Kofleriaceae bacterium]|nr:metalloregulator ArsR/SmtB family transcription factor [Kofleriaceae bacterium]